MPKVAGFDYNVYPGIPSGADTVSLSDSTDYIGVKGFIPNADGTLAVEMEDGSDATMIVKGGLQYSGSVRKFRTTGTITVTSVTVFY